MKRGHFFACFTIIWIFGPPAFAQQESGNTPTTPQEEDSKQPAAAEESGAKSAAEATSATGETEPTEAKPPEAGSDKTEESAGEAKQPEAAAGTASEAEPPAPKTGDSPPAGAAEQRPASARETAGRQIDGLVSETSTGRPLSDAIIEVRGTELRTRSGPEGDFVITAVPQGPVVLVISAQGYAAKEIAVPPGQREVDTELTLEKMEEIVVVGRATGLARRNLANAVGVVKPDLLVTVPAPTISEALQGKVAGANIQSNSGAPGGGIQIKLRGVSTINARATPLFVVDNVIVSDVAIPSGLSAVTESTRGSNASSTQDDQVNRIADLNPHDIESIEVLKGASAAAIYGSKASNGVVIITTKKGKAGEPEFHLTQRFGFRQLSNKLGSRTFTSVEEAVETFDEAARGFYEEGVVYDHEQRIAGRIDPSIETIGSVSGGTGDTNYFASFLIKDDAGIIKNTGYEKQTGRLRLNQNFGEWLEVSGWINMIHSQSQRGVTNNDNAGVSYYMVLPNTPNFADMRRRPDGTFPRNPFIGSGNNPLQTRFLARNNEDVWRVIGAVDGRLKIIDTDEHELLLLGAFGIDHFEQVNDLFFPPALHFEPADDLPGTSLFASSQVLNVNTSFNLVHNWEPRLDFLDKTAASAGFQFEEQGRNTVYNVGRNLTGGQPNLGAATQVQLTEQAELIRDVGYYLQGEGLLFDEHLTVIAALRGEMSSANGNPDGIFWYPKAALAYRLPFFLYEFMGGALDEIKLRVAYGEAGNLPLYGQKFTALSGRQNVEGIPGLIITNDIGSPTVRPERQREIESGIDIFAFDGRLILEFTFYHRSISDLLLERETAPSTGFGTQVINGGRMSNTGIELTVEAVPIQMPSVQWNSSATFSLNRSRVDELPVPAFVTGGFGASLGAYRIEEGASATQIIGNDGLKADGTCCEVNAIADAEPTFRVGFYNEVRFLWFSFSMLWDWMQGSSVINLTRFLYDLSGNTVDYVEAGELRLEDWRTQTIVYVEDASFLKLREIAVHFDVPKEWLELIYVGGVVDSARLSLSARNLVTITGYTGLDPEVSNFGNQAIARNIDVAPFPPSRSFWFTLDLRL